MSPTTLVVFAACLISVLQPALAIASPQPILTTCTAEFICSAKLTKLDSAADADQYGGVVVKNLEPAPQLYFSRVTAFRGGFDGTDTVSD